MELDEMKSLWGELSRDVEKQKVLTDKLINQMIQQRYNTQIRRISVPETIGAVLCVIMALVVILNAAKLDTWYFQLCGGLAVLYLLLFPFSVLRSIGQMKNINLAEKSYKESLLDYTRAARRFIRIQKLGIIPNFIFTIIALPLAGKLMSDKDLFQQASVWYWYLPMMILFLVVFSRWGLGYYKKMTSKTEALLKELEE